MKKIIVFFGPPCAGKGTYSKMLSQQIQLNVIDAGSMIRKEGALKTPFGLMAKALIDEGNLVSDEDLIPKMRDWSNEQIKPEGLIFDGYPRSIAQSVDLYKHIGVTHFIYLDAPIPILKERVIERGKVSGRADDNIEFFPTRINHYNKNAKPIIDYFTELNLLTKVDTSDPIEVVYNKLYNLINDGL